MPADPRAVFRAVLVLGLIFLTTSALGITLEEGRKAFSRQDWKSAVGLLTQFLTENPESPEAPTAAFLRGVSLYQQGEFRASLDAFQKLERTWPRSDFAPRLPYWKGTAALAAGQTAVAERELLAQTKILDQEPFTTRAWLNLALARNAQGKSDATIEALRAFTSASQEAALVSQAWALWGDLDRKAGRHHEALNHYEKARKANPGDRWDLWATLQSLDLRIALGRFEEAWADLEDGVSRFPDDARWGPRRVTVARGRGDGPGLMAALEAVWAVEPDPAKKQELASNRARAAEEGESPEPVWWLRASQGPLVPVGAAAIQRYAYFVEQEGRPAEASAALEAWAATVPLGGAYREEVRSRAALDRLVAGDTNGAASIWDALVGEFPRSNRMPGWLLQRGRIRLAAGDTTKALADFSRLIKDHPQAEEVSEARYQTGLVYLERQEPARAEAWFYPLIEELGSGDLYERALLARGICFVNAGKNDLARGSLTRLIRESPNGTWTAEAWAALGRNALQISSFQEAAQAYGQAADLLTDPLARASALWSQAEALAGVPDPDAASKAFDRYASEIPSLPKAAEARYRQGSVFVPGKDWARALEVWKRVVGWVSGGTRAQVREGMATALLRLGRTEEAWEELNALEGELPSPEAWYRWGLAATSMGEGDWAVKAFQFLLQNHPSSSVAEAALPRAAGALLSGGRPDEAMARYADYFRKFGRQSAAAPVARAASMGALAFPATLEALIGASKTWDLAPEVAAEFSLAWAQSRLDADSEVAQAELQALSQSAPWASQRSEALWLLGRWHKDRGRLAEARRLLTSATAIGDDLSVFKARWSLAQVTEAEGDPSAAARQKESAEKAAGPGVPLEFRLQVLREAVESWTKAGKGDEASRVKRRIATLEG